MTSPAQKTHLSHPHPTPSPPGGTCPAKGSTSNPFLAGLPRRLGVDKLLARLLLRGVPANRMIPPRLPRAIRLASTPCLSKPRHRELSPKFLGGHTPLPTSTAFTSICPAPRPGNIDLRPQVQVQGLLHLRNYHPNPDPSHIPSIPLPRRGVQPRRWPTSVDLASGKDSKKESQPPFRHVVPRRALRSRPYPKQTATQNADPERGALPSGSWGLAATSSTPTAPLTQITRPGWSPIAFQSPWYNLPLSACGCWVSLTLLNRHRD